MNSDSHMRNSMRNVLFGLMKYAIMIFVPFIMRTVLIYKLGLEYAGITSLFTSVLQVLSLTELGFSSAVVYSLYEPVAKNDTQKIGALLKLFKRIYIICGTVILLAGIAICPFINHFINGGYPSNVNIYWIYLLLLFNTAVSYLLCGYKSVLFIAYQRDDIGSKCQIISNLVMYCFQLFALVVASNYYMYIVSMLAGTVINNLLMYRFAKRMFPEIRTEGLLEKEERNKIYSNVKALFGHQLDTVVITSADNIVISAFIGLSVLTVYNNYYFVISSMLSVLIMVANSFVASIGNSIATESREKNYRDFISFTYFLGIINIGAAVMMLVLFQDFMEMWMGSQRMFTMDIVILLIISFYVRQFRRSIVTYKSAAGVWKTDRLKPYVAAVFNLVTNILLVKIIGLSGVIISTIASMVLIEIPWEIHALFKFYFQRSPAEYLITQLTLIAKLLVVSVCCYAAINTVRADTVLLWIWKAVLCFGMAAGMLAVLSFRDREFKKGLAFIKKR